MADHVENGIRKALWQCANGEISLDEFREWFLPISVNIEDSGEFRAIELAHSIDGILAEASSGGWSEEEIRQEFATPPSAASPPSVASARVEH